MEEIYSNINSSEQLQKLNDKQSECMQHLDGNILILSGAGTGKTRIIVNRFLKHIENGTPAYRIMCVTFSNKAANEITKRVYKILGEVSGTWIGTFHGICFRLLQKYGGIASNISIIDENDQKNIVEKLGIIEHLKNIQLYKENLKVEETLEFQKAYNKYQDFINNNNLIDFGEIILKTINLIEKNEEIQQNIQNSFDYILVDEYQDTSRLQNKLIQLIANKNLCCVGDDDQSIYSWRGACVDNILNFKTNFHNVKIFKLEQNYRCTKEILNVANHIIKQNINRMNKELWTENIGEKVEICNTKYEGDFIAQEIRNLPLQENVGILVRSSALIKPIEMSLIKYGVNYKIFGGLKFFEKLEIKTAIAYLKAVFLEDILSIERVLTTPKRGIGPKKLERLLEQIQNGLSFFSSLREIGYNDLVENITKWKLLKNGKPSLVMQTIWCESGCEELFKERKENIDILLKKLDEFKTIDKFLENFFSIDADEEARVSIMTIHGAKGLEFDNVFIPGLVEGIFPNSRTIIEGSIEEERRLAYVGITRARKKLFLTYDLSKNYSRNMFGPSRFLFNLPKNSINYTII